MSGVEHPQEVPAGERETAASAPPDGADRSQKRHGVSIPAQRPGEAHGDRRSVDGPLGRFDDPATGRPAAERPGMRRGVHATSATQLLLSMPRFLLSLIVVLALGQLVAAITGAIVWVYVIVATWLGSGPLVLWRPVENAVAVVVMRLRRPTLRESEVLDSAWIAVTRSAAIEGRAYRLWVEESDEVNATAAGGRTIAVSRWALRLPSRQLEAVLAHELGHHLAGHTWIAILGYWYSLPGRAAMAAVRFLLWLIVDLFEGLGVLGIILGIVVAIAVLGLGVVTLVSVPLLLVAAVQPFLYALTMRQGELYADRVAARLGYGEPLVEVLYRSLEEGEDVDHWMAGWRERALAPHPPVASRIRALETYLRQLPS